VPAGSMKSIVVCMPPARQQTRQQPAFSNGSADGSIVFYVVYSEAISRNQPSSVQFSSVSGVQYSGVKWVM
jgi:hypothetical protein